MEVRFTSGGVFFLVSGERALTQLHSMYVIHRLAFIQNVLKCLKKMQLACREHCMIRSRGFHKVQIWAEFSHLLQPSFNF